MFLLTILDKEDFQYECSVGTFKEILEWCDFLEDNPSVLKYKVNASYGNCITQKSIYHENSTKWVERFYEN